MSHINAIASKIPGLLSPSLVLGDTSGFLKLRTSDQHMDFYGAGQDRAVAMSNECSNHTAPVATGTPAIVQTPLSPLEKYRKQGRPSFFGPSFQDDTTKKHSILKMNRQSLESLSSFSMLPKSSSAAVSTLMGFARVKDSSVTP